MKHIILTTAILALPGRPARADEVGRGGFEADLAQVRAAVLAASSQARVLPAPCRYQGEALGCRNDSGGRCLNGVTVQELLQTKQGECGRLAGADLRRADLRKAELRGAMLNRAVLDGADLRGADLRGAEMREVEANGDKTDFSGAVLVGADLYLANLNDARLIGADLRLADLTDVSIYDARLDRADLRGTNLDIHIFAGATFEGAIYNEDTRGPVTASDEEAWARGMIKRP